MVSNPKWINRELYEQIVEHMPLLCVDVILTHKDKYVLVKRANEPLIGEWWVVGGRVLKNESVLFGAYRKVKEETDLEAGDFKIIGIYEDFYLDSAHGVPTHSVSVVVSASVKDFKPKLDDTSTDIGLFDELPDRFITKTIML